MEGDWLRLAHNALQRAFLSLEPVVGFAVEPLPLRAVPKDEAKGPHFLTRVETTVGKVAIVPVSRKKAKPKPKKEDYDPMPLVERFCEITDDENDKVDIVDLRRLIVAEALRSNLEVPIYQLSQDRIYAAIAKHVEPIGRLEKPIKLTRPYANGGIRRFVRFVPYLKLRKPQ